MPAYGHIRGTRGSNKTFPTGLDGSANLTNSVTQDIASVCCFFV